MAIISGAVGIAGAVILGILYGREASRCADLLEQLTLSQLARARAELAEKRIKEVADQRKKYISTLEHTLVEKSDPRKLAATLNGLLADHPSGDAD